jgi:hypothetical protein
MRALALGFLSMVKFINPDAKIWCPQNEEEKDPDVQRWIESYRPGDTLHALLHLLSTDNSGSMDITVELDSLRRILLNHKCQIYFPMPQFSPDRCRTDHWEPFSREDLEISIVTSAVLWGAFNLVKAKLKTNPELLRHSRHSLLLAASSSEVCLDNFEIDESLAKFIMMAGVHPNEHKRLGACHCIMKLEGYSSFSWKPYFPNPPWTTGVYF